MIAPKIDRETRLDTAHIALGTRENLFAGGFGRAGVVFARREAIVIADTALVYDRRAGDSAAFVVEGERVVRRPVETGLRRSGQVEIRSGLAPGERVVAKAGALLRDGDAVTAVDTAPIGSTNP